MRKPNIIFILADDLGYGDVSCLNPDGKIPTPCMDRLAREGVSFTDAHAASAVCSPSRYAVLTGRYCWRTMSHGIVNVYGDPLIPPSRMTVANLLKTQGYDTACFGKWHLGMGWHKTDKPDPFNPQILALDFTRPVSAGPATNGFDTYFGVDVPNWPPYCFIEGDRTIGTPSIAAPFGISNEEISTPGPCLEGWKLEEILPAITRRACSHIRAKAREGKPFFIYLPLTSPHTPLAVNAPWKGKSGLNLYADFVMETDARVGQVLDALDDAGVADDTLVVFASDNGCARYVGVDELEAKGHFPSHIYRGYKTDAWDGGHRVPLLARWPSAAKPGRVCDRPVSLADFFATVADITGAAVPDNAGEDSFSFLPALTGAGNPCREAVIGHSFWGRFAVCKDNWKAIFAPGSGGFNGDGGRAGPSDPTALKLGLPKYQLYDMANDPGEQDNLYPARPETTAALRAIVEDAIARGRSTPGAPQPNDLPRIEVDSDFQSRGYSFIDDWLETNPPRSNP
ncbi:MAG: arylsulfatase [Kiritimatiellaeota bacterium]|nr:arylsulfatase [Kiritimatiellota bacterium]